jgi:hypothetical protein
MYEVVLRDDAVERVDDADVYAQEGQMTTFFLTEDGRRIIDCWATRVASIRTAEIRIIRRLGDREGFTYTRSDDP